VKTVAHYELIDTIGRGGMGVVYKARDTKLGRLVALKFLPEDRATDKRLIARFRREARAASALNHPNICTIYDIDDVDGQTFIVMELLSGVSLKEFINGKALAPDVAIPIALDIADALEASHANGIVHRDIKPSNVFVCANNRIKVLDFGLALQTEPADVPGQLGRTIDAHELTASGTAIGTIAYMSPEQARCEEVDGRADLFSFGAVLYEMVTGKGAFAAGSIAQTFEAILNGRPKPPSQSNSAVTSELDAIVLRLLEKKRERRYQSVAELKTDLQRLRGDWTRTQIVTISKPKPLSRLLVALVVVLAAASAWLGYRFLQQKPVPAADHSTLTLFTSQPGPEWFPSFSPDGKTIAYASMASGNWDIYLQRVGGSNPINLTIDSKEDDTEPAFSPSGDSIAFRSERDGGGIFVMGATGESARRITDSGFNPAWSPDGKQLVFAEENIRDNPQYRYTTSALWTVNVATGEKKKLFAGDAVQPQWSPHSDRIVYWAKNSGQRHIWTIRPDGTDAVPLTNDAALDWSPAWSADGKVIYFSSDRGGASDLWRIPVNEKSGRSTGNAEAVTKGGTAQRLHPTISADGQRIAYVEETVTENILQVSFDPVFGKVTGVPKAITAGDRTVSEPDLSPDGKRVTFQSLGKKMAIYVIGADGKGERKLTDDDFQYRVPRWSPDGKQLAVYSNRSGHFQIWSINVDGSGMRQVSDEASGSILRAVWSPDGDRLAGSHEGGSTFILNLLKGESVHPIPAPADPAELFDVWTWSPDGEWLAGHRKSRKTGTYEGIAVYSLKTGTFQNLTDSGTSPVWLKDSRRLLFVRDGVKISVLDRQTRQTTDVFDARPNVVESLSQLSKDNNTIVFSVQQREADIWLINRESPK
jgi:Tol biopolymer transport system component/tRNA A-37 threonylcarbamoyl transferase component Bud32